MEVVPTSAQPPTEACSRDRDGTRRDPAADHSTPARTCPSRDYVDLSARDRYARDHRHGAPPPTAGDSGQRRPTPITNPERGPVSGASPASGAQGRSPSQPEQPRSGPAISRPTLSAGSGPLPTRTVSSRGSFPNRAGGARVTGSGRSSQTPSARWSARRFGGRQVR
jgi:hypothetical protein